MSVSSPTYMLEAAKEILRRKVRIRQASRSQHAERKRHHLLKRERPRWPAMLGWKHVGLVRRHCAPSKQDVSVINAMITPSSCESEGCANVH
eukprot:1495822-Pyramimonas_sp.AAC.1